MDGPFDVANGGAYGPVRAEDLDAVLEILSWCFHFSVDDARGWVERSGLDRVRALRDARGPVACLLLVPMGQFFGGRPVPMTGIVAVGSAPERRGGGAAERLMAETVRELHAKGVALSTLYPATRALYRRAGYEPAGSHYLGKAPIASLRVRASEPVLRAMTDADAPAVIALYREHAARMNGFLDRGDYVWNRIRTPRGEPTPRGFVIEGDVGIDGYFYVMQKPSSTPAHVDLRVTDLVTRSPAAARRALAFFARHWTLSDTLHLHTGPADPFALAFPEESLKTELWHHWMLRIVDVPRALEARGYLPGFEVEVELDVTDEIVPDNVGRFVLAISEGRAEVRRGGSGALRLDVRGLAALYSGFLAPPALAAAGLVAGDDRVFARASLAFAGQAPWMPDGF